MKFRIATCLCLVGCASSDPTPIPIDAGKKEVGSEEFIPPLPEKEEGCVSCDPPMILPPKLRISPHPPR